MTEGSKTRKKLLVTPEPCYQIGGQKAVSRHTQLFRNGARGYLERKSSVSTNQADFRPNHFTNKPFVSYLHRNKRKSRIRKRKPRDQKTGKSK